MTVTIKNIIPAKQAEVTQETQYTAVNCKTIIDKFTGTNVSAGNVTLSVNLVANGDVESVSNLIVDARSIAPGETYQFPELVGQSLGVNDFISTICDTGAALVIMASGREIT